MTELLFVAFKITLHIDGQCDTQTYDHDNRHQYDNVSLE